MRFNQLRFPRVFACHLSCIKTLLSILATTCFSTALTWGQTFPFVIPGNDSSDSATNRSVLLEQEAGQHGFIRVQNGHFANDQGRIRFWGMNLCFAANLPTHEEADNLAPHFAKLGINAIRFHHMDHHAAPNGIWAARLVNGQRVLDPQMVDRLDYFLARLHENGIYADLNLHVSRELTPEEGFPTVKDGPWWSGSNKWVMYYDKDVQAELKRYCRMLLTHPNPYRNGLTRVNDPGIALVEMLNENYFSLQGYELYQQLPERFQNSFIQAWNQWLKEKYVNQEAMTQAWDRDQPKLGDFLISDQLWKKDIGNWQINRTQEQLPRTLGLDLPDELSNYSSGVLRFQPKEKTEHNYQQQLLQNRLSVRKDQPLTIRFWIRSDHQRKVQIELSTSSGGNWRSLGLMEEVTITPQWQEIKRVIMPPESVKDEVNFAFNFGLDDRAFEICQVTLQEGIEAQPLPPSMRLEQLNIGIPESGWPLKAHNDMKQFMFDTERSWIAELKDYLKTELGVKVPITASQLNYHPPEIVEDLADFADLHNYWHHPVFPAGMDWSPTEWTVGNDPIEADPTRSSWPTNSLLMRAGWRWADKPMTMTEWNYSEPSPYSSGAVLTAASIAAIQDWDAVFFFEYDSFMTWGPADQRPFFRDHVNSFFGFNGQPLKLALFSQAANLFLRGDLPALTSRKTALQNEPYDGRLAFSHQIGVRGSGMTDPIEQAPDSANLKTPGGTLQWINQPPSQGELILNTQNSIGVWGTVGKREFKIGNATMKFGETDHNYGSLTISSIDGKPLHQTNQALLLVTGHSENQGMIWNPQHTSVGNQWGHGPTMVTIPEVTIALDSDWSFQTIQSLDATGKPIGNRKRITKNENSATIKVGPKDKTIWFLLEK